MSKTISSELTQQQLDALKNNSGGDSVSAITLPILNRIQLNGEVEREEGKDGTEKRIKPYYRKIIFVGKDQDAIPVKENIGSDIELRLVKIRRKMVARDDTGKTVLSTSQYGNYDQVISVYQDGKKVSVQAADTVYDTYESLKPRTQLEVYAITPEGERVLLILKGTAINARKRPVDKPSFKQYVTELNKEGGIAFFTTILGGEYVKDGLEFNIVTFTKGRPTTNEEKLETLAWQNELNEVMIKYDEANARHDTPKNDTDTVASELTPEDIPFAPKNDMDTVASELTPEDIPFAPKNDDDF